VLDPRFGHSLRLIRPTMLLVALIASRTASSAALDLPVERYRLTNGLRVIIAPDPALANVTLRVRYDVGTGDDPDGLEGIAHLVEHLQFGGSKHVAPGDHQRLLEAAGGSAFVGRTSLDWTMYGETMPPEALELALWLESDRMGFAADGPDESRVAHERTILVHEYQSSVIDSQFGSAQELLHNEIFPAWHPYRGLMHWFGVNPDIRLRDVKAFLGTWYSPANATLILVGPVDETTALALAKKYFESLPSVPPPARPALQSWSVGDTVIDATARLSHQQVLIGWRTPPFHEPGDRELDIAARLLAGPSGILVRELVNRGLATAVGARQASHRADSTFLVSVQVADGVRVEPIGDAIERAVSEIAGGVSESDIARARKPLMDGAILGLETSFGRASRLADTIDLADPWDLHGYERIDSAQVAAAIRRFLTPQARAAMVLYPAVSTRLPSEKRIVVEHRERRLP
jgi:zinc protease